MSRPIIVNQSTTLVQVDTSVLLAPYIVLLSNLNSPGSLLTIRDSTGNASLTNNIIISTTTGVKYLDGGGINENIYTINQPYGFLSITPKTSNIWGVVNTFAFPDASASANLNIINVSSINVSTIAYIQRANISTALISTLCTVNVFIEKNLSVGESTIAHAGFYTCSIRSLQDIIGASDIYAGSTLSSMFANITSTLTVPYISTQNVFVYGGLQTASSISTSGPMFVGSSISTTGNLAVGASTFIQGQLTVLQAAFFNSSISTKGALNVGFETILNSSLTVGSVSTLSNMTVGASLSVMSTLYTRWNSYHESSILALGSFSTLEDVNIRRNLSTLGNVFIAKEVFTTSSMLITGAISTLHDINVRSNVSILGNLYVKGDVVFDDLQLNLQDIVASSIYTQNSISTMSSLIAGGFLHVNGSTLLRGTVCTLSNFNIRGLLSTASSIIVGDSLDVFNTGFFGSNISTPSSIGIGNRLNVGGPTNLQGFLSTFGQSAFFSSMQIQGSVSVMSSVVISCNLDVGNTLTAKNVNLNGSTFISTLAVTNTIGFGLNISSSTLHYGLFSTSGAMNIGGLISTTNALIVGSTINTQLLAVRSGMSVFSDAGFAQDIYARSSIIIGMSTILRGPLFTQSPSYLADALFTSNVVIGIPDMFGDSVVNFRNNGTAFFQGNVTVNRGILQLSNILKIAAPVTGITTNTISNDTEMNNLSVTGLAKTGNIEILGGRASDGNGSTSNMIAFQIHSGGYRHFITSRHTPTANVNTNSIDFWINNSTDSAASLTPALNNTARGNVNSLSITAAGVGINCNAPVYRLDVNGTTNLNGVVRLKTGVAHIADDAKQRFYYTSNGTTFYSSGDGTHTFQNVSLNVNTVSIDNTGNITTVDSIKTTNGLFVRSDAGFIDRMNGAPSYGIGQGTTPVAGTVQIAGYFGINFVGGGGWSQGSSHMVIRNGRIGIGLTDPQYTLDVTGTTNLNGTVRFKTGVSHVSDEGVERFIFYSYSTSYYKSPNGLHIFRNNVGTYGNDLITIDGTDAPKLGIGKAPVANLDVSGTLNVSRLTTLSNTSNTGTLGVSQATTLSGTLNVTGATSLGGTLNVTGATSLGGTLNVTGLTTLVNSSNTGYLGVAGATTLSGTLGVAGATTLTSSSNTGTLGVAGVTTLASNLEVGNSGFSVFNSNITGYVNGGSIVYGRGAYTTVKHNIGNAAGFLVSDYGFLQDQWNITFNCFTHNAAWVIPHTGYVPVRITLLSGAIQFKFGSTAGTVPIVDAFSFDKNGNMSAEGNMSAGSFSGPLNTAAYFPYGILGGDSSNTGNVGIGGTLTVTGATTLRGTLGVTGLTTLVNSSNTGYLGVTGATTLSGTLGVTGVTTLTSSSNTGTLGVAGATTLSGTLGVSQATTLSGTLGVTGQTTFSSKVGIFTNSPSAQIDILGGRNATNGAIDSNLIAFQYYTGGFRHFITSRHNGIDTNHTGNAIDFWLNKSSSPTGSSGPSVGGGESGNVNSFSITAAGIGIFKSNPAYSLDVNGSLNVAQGTTLSGTLGVTQGTTLSGTLGVTGLTTLVDSSNTGYLGVAGATTLSGTLGVTGLTTLVNSSNTGYLGVAGATTLSGTLGVTGLTTLVNSSNTGTLGVAGQTKFSSNVGINCNSPNSLYRLDVGGIINCTEYRLNGAALTTGIAGINSTGSIGINKTSRARFGLDVTGRINGDNDLTIGQTNSGFLRFTTAGNVSYIQSSSVELVTDSGVIQSGNFVPIYFTGMVGTPNIMAITSTGVGIGTTSPLARLDIKGGDGNTGITTSNTGSNLIAFQFNGGGYTHYIRSRHVNGTNNSQNALDFWIYSSSNGEFGSPTAGTGNVNTLSITAAGIGIFNYTPAHALDVSGNIRASGDVTAGSDRRYKENIVTIDSALDKVTSMRGVYFTKKDSSNRHVGVIAQEIEEILPEVVHTDSSEEKMKSVSYGNITAVLIEAIKEQQGIINAQQSTINGILSKLPTLPNLPN